MDGPITWEEVVWASPAQIRANLGSIGHSWLAELERSGEIRTIRTRGGMRRFFKADIIEWFRSKPERLAVKREKQAATWDAKRAAGDMAAQTKGRKDFGPPELCQRPVHAAGLCRQHSNQQSHARRLERKRLARMAQMPHSAVGTEVGAQPDAVLFVE